MLSTSKEDTRLFAASFLSDLKPNENGATIVGLVGDLGSGKTTFVKYVAEALGVKEVVTSPTFVIEKVYKVDHPKFDRLVHVDAYRLDSKEDLVVLGWKDTVNNPRNFIMVEWPGRIAGALPPDSLKVNFRFVDESSREIEIDNG